MSLKLTLPLFWIFPQDDKETTKNKRHYNKLYKLLYRFGVKSKQQRKYESEWGEGHLTRNKIISIQVVRDKKGRLRVGRERVHLVRLLKALNVLNVTFTYVNAIGKYEYHWKSKYK